MRLPAVADIIRSASRDVAAGSVQTTAGEILLRVKARKQWAEEFAKIEIVSGRSGPSVKLGDIATIRDGFEEVGFHSQFSQTPSVELDIFRVGSQSPIDVARAVEQTMDAVAQLLGSLGVTKSHSRPHVSNDNPFSESQFKTMKYRPEFPKRFGCHEDALQFCREFFDWYNNEHYHSGIGLLTPSSLHYGRAAEITTAREETLQRAWQNNPERFVGGIPKPASLPKAVWINAPKRESEIKNEAPEANCPGAPEAFYLPMLTGAVAWWVSFHFWRNQWHDCPTHNSPGSGDSDSIDLSTPI